MGGRKVVLPSQLTNTLYRQQNEKEDKNAAKSEQTEKHEQNLDTPLTKNESKFRDANSKTCLQTQQVCPYKLVENKVGSNLIGELSAENSELELVKSS